MIEGGVTSFVRTDHIGRPVFATNTAGTQVWTASPARTGVRVRSSGKQSTGLFSDPPHPFGGVRTTTGTPINARFPGQWFQSESSLHQNWMRDYDPTTGRYLQADPLGLVAGMSAYGYANQSPMMYVDPNGENPLLVAMLAGAALGLLFEGADQFMDYGFNFQCWDPYALAKSGLIGGATGALGGVGAYANPLLKSFGIGKVMNWKGSTRLRAAFENSHFISDAYFRNATSGFGASRLGQWFNRSGLNTSYQSWLRHALTDKTAFRFLRSEYKQRYSRFALGEATWARFPPWMLGGAGALVEAECVCEP